MQLLRPWWRKRACIRLKSNFLLGDVAHTTRENARRQAAYCSTNKYASEGAGTSGIARLPSCTTSNHSRLYAALRVRLQ